MEEAFQLHDWDALQKHKFDLLSVVVVSVEWFAYFFFPHNPPSMSVKSLGFGCFIC
jgi:hypothetical protein